MNVQNISQIERRYIDVNCAEAFSLIADLADYTVGLRTSFNCNNINENEFNLASFSFTHNQIIYEFRLIN